MTQPTHSALERIGGRRVVLGFLLVCVVMLGAARIGRADPDDEGPAANGETDLFAELLASEGDGEWRGVLIRIREERDAKWIGTVLGKLFRDPSRYPDHGACAAYTAAYLADHPENDRVLLGEAIVRRAHGDAAFLTALRAHITKGQGGWERLLSHARQLLGGDDLRGRRDAIYFLSHADGALRETVFTELLTRAEADLALAGGANGARSGLEREYLEAFQRLLGYRFADLEQAVKTLRELETLDFGQLLLELSCRKDLPTAPDRMKLVEYGKRLVDRVVEVGNVEAIEEFLDPHRTPYAALRRYAVQKAALMAPEANTAWGRLFRLVLAEEEDPEVLRGVLDLLERTDLAEAPDVAARIASALASRLAARGLGATGPRDARADRVRMARLLAILKVRSAELERLLASGDRLEGPVLAELVRALGGFDDVSVDEVLVHYRASSDDAARVRLIRVAAVDALGRRGFRGDSGQQTWAAGALREILTGEGEAGLGRSEDDLVRQHAIRSIGSHPGPETAQVLGAIAAADSSQEAGVAIVVLRKAGLADEDAVTALGTLARDDELAPGRRVEVLRALAELANGERGPRRLAREAARAVLESGDVPDEVRLEAAAASARLADAEALAPVTAWWSAGPNADRRSALRALVLAVAKAGAETDGAVVTTIGAILAAGDATLAGEVAAALVEETDRAVFRREKARVLLAQAADEDAALDERRKAAGAAMEQLRRLDRPSEAGTPDPAVGALLVRALRRVGDLAGEDGARVLAYMEALHRAAASAAPDVLRLGLETADRLQTDPLAPRLTQAQTATVANDRKAILEKLQ